MKEINTKELIELVENSEIGKFKIIEINVPSAQHFQP